MSERDSKLWNIPTTRLRQIYAENKIVASQIQRTWKTSHLLCDTKTPSCSNLRAGPWKSMRHYRFLLDREAVRNGIDPNVLVLRWGRM